MDDLVKRLRSQAWEDRQHRQLREEAADEIERLTQSVDAYRAECDTRLHEIDRLIGERDRLRKDRDEARESRDAWIRARDQLAAELDGAVLVRKAWERAFAERGLQIEQLTAERDDLRKQWQAEQHVVEVLRSALLAAKRTHYTCEDCWYSCPASGECCDEKQVEGECNCGADRHNAAIDAAMKAGEA